MRRLAARAHSWGGMVLGPLVLVLGLSGAALVFRAELDGALHTPPGVAAAGSVRSLDAIVAAARLAHPGAEPRALHVPARADRPYRVEVASGARRLDVAVDPYTLAVVDSRAPERSVLVAVHALHAGFHAGRPGAVVVALVGVALVVESLTGLWLYGPSVWRRPRRGRPPAHTVHRILGAASLVLALVLGVTGAALALARASHAVAPPAAGRLARSDALAAAVATAVPGARVRALVAESAGRVRVETDRGMLYVHSGTAAVVAGPAPPMTGAWDLVRRLHYGDFAGWPSRLLYGLLGLAVAALVVTGYLIGGRARG